MRVLLSAYSCEPNKGSEASLGWYWGIELARLGHEVWVITRANNQPSIEQELSANPIAHLYFIYYDLPTWSRWWKGYKGGVYLYYFLWQWGAYRLVKSLNQQVAFDWVHHVTFVSIRQPSFMGLLDIPFIFGPVGGGESAPQELRKSYPLSGWLQDFVRDLVNSWVRFDPLMHLTFSKAAKIFVTSKQTQKLLPKRYRHKSHIRLAIGIDSAESSEVTEQKSTETDFFKLLFVGRLLYWKGLHLGLKAFAQFYQEMPNSQLTVIGSGADAEWLHKLAEQLGINSAINWISWMTQQEVMLTYQQHDVFLYPSLHDSGGIVVLEALIHGLPVVCLDLGGPGVMVDDSCGRILKTEGSSETTAIQSLNNALKELAGNTKLRSQLSRGALKRSQDYRWEKVVGQMYRTIEQGCFVKSSSD